MTEKTHTFDWCTEPQTSFLSWMLPVVLGDIPSTRPDEFEALSEATDSFNNVELKIVISGIEVDAKRFMERVEQTMNDSVDREVAKKLESMTGFDELHDEVAEFESAFKHRIRKLARENGIEMDEDRW